MVKSILEGNSKKSNNQSVTLSKAHIRPFSDEHPRIDYVLGASYIRTTKDMKFTAVGGGARGGIKGFSAASRRRLLEIISYVRRDAELPCFVTLTYPNKFPTVERSKRDLKVFLQRMSRKYPKSGLIWKLEPQQRGAPHFHMLVWGVDRLDLLCWVVGNWFEIAGDGDYDHYLFHMGSLRDSEPCVNKVRSFRGVWSYASKYIGKTFDVAEWGSQWTGRFWGVVNRHNIPLGELSQVEMTYSDVVQVMRFQRRFMNMRKTKNLNSLKTFCDADQWIRKVTNLPWCDHGGVPSRGGDIMGPPG
jgi:hypothetical protein